MEEKSFLVLFSPHGAREQLNKNFNLNWSKKGRPTTMAHDHLLQPPLGHFFFGKKNRISYRPNNYTIVFGQKMNSICQMNSNEEEFEGLDGIEGASNGTGVTFSLKKTKT